jgi:putative transposase
MPDPEPLQPGQYYHIYNRGINGEPLFREQRNYPYFLKLYVKYIEPVAETYAYCLLSNHFHLLVRIKEIGPVSETGPILDPSRQYNNLFIAYAKAFNKAYQRTGGLFESPFKRKLVDNDHYFTCLVAYIHRNPQKHGFVQDFRDWPYSSYHAILSSQPSRIQRAAVLEWFTNRDGFEDAHMAQVDEATIEPLISDDWM